MEVAAADEAEDKGVPGVVAGTTIAGRYAVVRLLGAGGMGAVYEARHIAIGRRVALKLLRPGLATRAEVIARFLREARTATEVRHRNIVEVLDFGVDDGRAFLVMEYLVGESLRAVIAREAPMAPRRAAELLLPACRALEYAHTRGVVHRDVKPDNLFVAREDGTGATLVKVLDFGIAATETPGETRLTRSGMALGTPLYMAPEQASGARDVTPAADQYAVGCVLYEALTGRAPLVEDNYNALIVAKVTRSPERIDEVRPGLDAALADAVMQMLAREPGARLPSLGALVPVLERAARSERAATPTSDAPLAFAHTALEVPSLLAGSPVEGRPASTDPSPAAPTPGPVDTPARWEAPSAESSREAAVAGSIDGARTPVRGAGRKSIALGAAGAAVLAAVLIAGVMMLRRTPPGHAAAARPERAPATSAPPPAAVQVTFSFEFTPPTTEIYLAGVYVGRGRASVLRERDGRRYELRATAPGYAPHTEVIEADQSLRIERALVPDAQQPLANSGGAPSSATSLPPAPTPPGRHQTASGAQPRSTGNPRLQIHDDDLDPAPHAPPRPH